MKYLGRLGFLHMKEASDGMRAMEMIRDECFDLVISDLIMEDCSGIDLLRSIKQNTNTKGIVFIMATVVSDKNSIIKALKIGADGFVIKPFTPDMLKEKIFKAFDAKMERKTVLINNFLKKGLAHKAKGDHYRAIVEFQKALEICETAEVHYQIGDIYLQEDRTEDAIPRFKRALKLDFLFIKAYKSLGDIYMKDGRYSEALGYLSKANRIDPTDKKVLNTLGSSYMKLSRYDTAEKIFKKVLDLDPDATEAIEGLSDAYIHNRKEDKALELIDRVLAQKPDLINLYNRRGIIFRRRGEHALAIENYRRAIEIDPCDAVLRFNIAKAFLSTDDKPNGIKELRKALHISPEFQQARKLLQEIFGEINGEPRSD